MLGEHLGQCGFAATDISCYDDVHVVTLMMCYFTIYKDKQNNVTASRGQKKVINN